MSCYPTQQVNNYGVERQRSDYSIVSYKGVDNAVQTKTKRSAEAPHGSEINEGVFPDWSALLPPLLLLRTVYF